MKLNRELVDNPEVRNTQLGQHCCCRGVSYAVPECCANRESMISLNWRFGRAPTRRSTACPPLKKRIVGMLMTWYRPAISGFSSVLSLHTFSFPAYSPANSSIIGATIWHGPHHTAQKSTNTSSGAFITSVSHVASLTFCASPPTDNPPSGFQLSTTSRENP